MNTKTKSIIAVVTIFILTGIVVSYVYQARNKPQDALPQQQAAQQEPELSQTQNASDFPKTDVSTNVSNGTIISISEKKLSVKTDNGNSDFNILGKTSVYAIQGAEVLQKNVSDLKAGSQITFEYDEKTKDLLAIQLIQ